MSRSAKVCFKKSEYILYEPYPGLHLAYHAKKFCFSGRSDYQQIDIIENDAYGRMLFLDGNVQHTTYDSRIFNEALCGPAKKNAVARVIVLGGGSGQTAMALLESPSIEHVAIVEIDPLVVECCRKHIRGVDRAFKDHRVRIIVGDAFSHLHCTDGRFDAAIIDLTERPLWAKSSVSTLKRVYADIKEKCGGRCSQYVGSTVKLSRSEQTKTLVARVGRRFFQDVRFEEVFIPSFGAPHAFMHAGYNLP